MLYNLKEVGRDYMYSKEEIRVNVMSRQEAEDYLGFSKQNFQSKLDNDVIPIFKTYIKKGGSRPIHFFWKPDLDEYKNARQILGHDKK